jgi:hypothetical protein
MRLLPGVARPEDEFPHALPPDLPDAAVELPYKDTWMLCFHDDAADVTALVHLTLSADRSPGLRATVDGEDVELVADFRGRYFGVDSSVLTPGLIPSGEGIQQLGHAEQACTVTGRLRWGADEVEVTAGPSLGLLNIGTPFLADVPRHSRFCTADSPAEAGSTP